MLAVEFGVDEVTNSGDLDDVVALTEALFGTHKANLCRLSCHFGCAKGLLGLL